MFDVKFAHVFVDFIIIDHFPYYHTVQRSGVGFVAVFNWCGLFEDIFI